MVWTVKDETVFFLCLIFFILGSLNAYSLGITARNSVQFEPGLDKDYTICIMNSKDYEFPVVMDVTGPLKDYITLSQDQFVLSPSQTKCLTYNLHLPQSLDMYGSILTKIWARQGQVDENGGLQVLVSIPHKLSVFVPYPDKYVTINLETEDVNENEPIQLLVRAKNYGDKDVKKANARIDVYGADDYSNYIDSLYTATKPIASMETVNFPATLETTGLKPGYYKADATLFYDGNKTSASELFKIGTLLVRINNYTSVGYSGRINQFDIDIESRWNNKIEGLYGQAAFSGIKGSVTTPTVDIDRWEKTRLTGYLDLSGVAPGDYKGNITLHYGNETNIKSVVLSVLAKGSSQENPVTGSSTVAEDEPSGLFSSDLLSVTNILLLVILIMIILDFIFIWRRKRHDGKKQAP